MHNIVIFGTVTALHGMHAEGGYLSLYQANFTKGGLMVAESRTVARLLLDDVTEGDWKHAIEVDNVLEKRSPTTASTKAALIRSRLQTVDTDIWRLVADGDRPVATQAVLAATIKFSRLVGDFMDIVIRDLVRRFEPAIPKRIWDDFLEGCAQRDPDMPTWQPSTQNKLFTRVVAMLVESGYVNNNRERRLQPVLLEPEIVAYLDRHDEEYVLRCMQVMQ